jgi:hypothetical protein
MDTTMIRNISANYMSAQQAAADVAPRRELRHLLFAAQDIIELLKSPCTGDKDAVMGRQYAESLIHTVIRIEHLLKEELNARNTL